MQSTKQQYVLHDAIIGETADSSSALYEAINMVTT